MSVRMARPGEIERPKATTIEWLRERMLAGSALGPNEARWLFIEIDALRRDREEMADLALRQRIDIENYCRMLKVEPATPGDK